MTRVDLCRFFPGMTWADTGTLSWFEWQSLCEIMNAAKRQKRRDDGPPK